MPNVFGTGGGNDLTTVNGNLSINQNLTLGINPGASFGAGTYDVRHYNTVTNNSNNFSGWNSTFFTPPPNLANGQFLNLSFSNDTTHDNIDLNVAAPTTTPPTLSPGMSTTFVVSPTATASASANNTVKFSGNTGSGGSSPSFTIATARAAGTSPETFSTGWAVAPVQVAPDTAVFARAGLVLGYIPVPPDGPIPTSNAAPYQTAGFPCAFCVAQGAKNPGGAYYPAGNNFFTPLPDDWRPWFYLAPLAIVTDANPSPTLYEESYSIPTNLPNGVTIDPAAAYLADQTALALLLPQNGGHDERRDARRRRL